MAHRIIGLDIGERTIKAAVVDKALRKTTLTAVEREDIAIPGDSEAIQAALAKILSRTRTSGDDVVMTGLSTAPCIHRVLRFPFSEPAAIAESVSFELESHIPLNIDDLIVDHIAVGTTADDQTAVLAVGAPETVVARRLNMLRAASAEPRVLSLATLSYATLLGNLPTLTEGRSLVVDAGELSTELVIVEDGEVKWARSMSIGAAAIREDFAAKFDTETIQGDLLQTHALLLPPGVPPSQPSEQVLHAATVDALQPWLSELRISMAAARRDGVKAPKQIVLTGGMAGMRGLTEHVERTLRLPVVPINLNELELADGVLFADDRCALAVALALQGTELRTSDALDFRKGPHAFEGDFKFLQQRIPQIAAFVVVALCLLGVRTTVNYRALVHEHQRQRVQIGKLSKALTSKKIVSYAKLKKEMKRPLHVDLASYYPDISAIRTFEELSVIVRKVTEPPEFSGQMPTPGARKSTSDAGAHTQDRVLPGGPGGPRAPPPLGQAGGIRAKFGVAPGAADGPDANKGGGEEGEEKGAFEGHKVELLSIDIDRTKGSVRGDCDTQDALLAFQEGLNRHRCFHKVKSSSDRITFQRHKDWFRFTIRFEIHCSDEATEKALAKAKKAAKDKKAEKDRASSAKNGANKDDSGDE